MKFQSCIHRSTTSTKISLLREVFYPRPDKKFPHPFFKDYCKNFSCCQEETLGKMEFKGEYTFNEIPVNETVSMSCMYGGGFVNRKCLKDGVEVEWEDLNLSRCTAKSEVTQKLLDLEKVKYIVSSP